MWRCGCRLGQAKAGQSFGEMEARRRPAAGTPRDLKTPPIQFGMLGFLICRKLTKQQPWYLDQGSPVAVSHHCPSPSPRPTLLV